jgi:cytochrome P450
LTVSHCCHLCRETLRLSNVVASLPVEAAQDLQLGGYAVPAGTSMSIPFIQLAKNDPRWLQDEPEMFR